MSDDWTFRVNPFKYTLWGHKCDKCKDKISSINITIYGVTYLTICDLCAAILGKNLHKASYESQQMTQSSAGEV